MLLNQSKKQYNIGWSTDNRFCYNHIQIREKKPEDFNNRKQQNGKQIKKLLLIIIIADLDQFTTKSKSITHIRAFVKLNNQKNHEHVYKIYKMIEFEKQHFLINKYLRNFNAY